LEDGGIYRDSNLLVSAGIAEPARSLLRPLHSVSLISESIVTELKVVFRDPHRFVGLLASNLPKRGAYFMRLLVISACVGTLLELYRAVPLFQFAVRCCLGRYETEKQRSQAIGPFKPLCVVDKFYFSRIQARILLYFMVLFVYSSISPVVNWMCLIFFLFLGSVYRHQFVFNYPKTPDSGGEMWLMFVAVLLACMVRLVKHRVELDHLLLLTGDCSNHAVGRLRA